MSADVPQTPTKGESLAAIPRPYGSLKDLDPAAVLEEINKVLNQEDPNFGREMQMLATDDLKSNEALDSLEIASLEALTAASGTAMESPNAKTGASLRESFLQIREDFDRSIAKSFNRARQLITDIRELLKTSPKSIGPLIKENVVGALGDLKKVSPKTFGKVAAVLLLLGLCGFILNKTFHGGLFPAPKSDLLTALDQVADKNYEIEDDEEFEEFNSPLRHPEYVVSLTKMIVNLKSDSPRRNPMGMFEFYVEAATRDGAVEVNDRRKEVLDIMSRTVEKISYEDLITFQGKSKLKADLAREVNTLLTRGRVRRVYFKSIVLKP